MKIMIGKVAAFTLVRGKSITFLPLATSTKQVICNTMYHKHPAVIRKNKFQRCVTRQMPEVPIEASM